MKRFFKKTLAAILTCILVMPSNTAALADVFRVPETVVPTEISATPSETGSVVIFGSVGIEAAEEDHLYRVPIVRTGDLSVKDTVIVHTIDMTALYGKDYRLKKAAVEADAGEQTFLEMALTAEEEEPEEDGDSDAPVLHVELDPSTGEIEFKEESAVMPQIEKAASEAAEDTAEEELSGDEEAEPVELIEEAEAAELLQAADAALLTEEGEEVVEAAPEGSSEGIAEIVENVEVEPAEESAEIIEVEVVQEAAEAVEAVEAVESAAQEAAEKADAPSSDEAESAVTETVVKETVDGEIVLAGTTGDPAAKKVSLAELKEMATGEKAVISENTEKLNGFAQDLSMILMPEIVKSFKYSSELAVEFTEGQSVAYVNVLLLDDDLSEGTENFSLMLISAENAVIGETAAFSFTIKDDEEYELPKVSFVKDSYTIKNGAAEVTLTRSGLEQNLVTAVLSSRNEETGEEEPVGEVAFAPYQEEITVAVPAETAGTLELTEFTGAEAGEIVSSELLLGDEGDEEVDVRSLKIGDKTYQLELSKSEQVYGTIYDTAFIPKLEVGKYLLVSDPENGGQFEYSTTIDFMPFLKYAYYSPGSQLGILRLTESSSHPDRESLCENNNLKSSPEFSSLNDAAFYQRFMPEWGTVNETHASIRVNDDLIIAYNAELSRLVETGKIFGHNTIKDHHGPMSIRLSAKAPGKSDCRLDVYGIVLTEKSYVMNDGPAATMKFINGMNPDTGEYIYRDALPAEFKIDAGAVEPENPEARRFYVNPDPEKSTMLFSFTEVPFVDKSDLFDGKGIFAEVAGYDITINGDLQHKKTVNYPEDLKTYLNSKKGSEDYYSAENIQEYLSTYVDGVPENSIVFGTYFIDWIESVQREIEAESGKDCTVKEESGISYHQELVIKPVYKESPVTVTVEEPLLGAGTGWFKDKNLKAGNTYTFKAGDRLDFSAETGEGLRVEGYEISYDGVTFNTVTNGEFPVLQKGNKITVRPAVSSTQYIEIKTDSSISDGDVRIINEVPQELLKNTAFEGRHILDVNPSETALPKRISPEVGKVYSVDVEVLKKSENGYVYLPRFKDRSQTYGGERYSFAARNAQEDNVLTLSITKVKADKVKTWSVSGTAGMYTQSIRQDVLTPYYTPLSGYFVQAGSGYFRNGETGKTVVQDVSSLLTNGEYTLSGIKTVEGEKIRCIISNGLNDTQVFDIVLPSESDAEKDSETGMLKCDAEPVKLDYPFEAPDYVQLDYHYDSSEYDACDHTENEIQIYADESIKFTAEINPKGRKIKKAVFSVKHSDGRDSFTYEAVCEDPDKPNNYSFHIDDMDKKLYTGDYMTVHLVDEEKVTIKETQDVLIEMEITYPEVRTGLSFFEKNVKPMPKEFHVDTTEDIKPVNIPFLGDVVGSAGSNTTTLTKVKWNDDSFALQVNMDAMFSNSHCAAPLSDRMKAFNDYRNTVREALNKGKDSLMDGFPASDGTGSSGNAAAGLMDQDVPKPGDDEKQGAAKEKANSEAQKQALPQDDAGDDKAAAGEQGKKGKWQDAKVNFDIIICLDLEFVRSAETEEFVCSSACGTISGIGTVSNTFVYFVEGIPCYLNVRGDGQVSLMFGEVYDGAKEAMTESDIHSYAGDMADILEGGSNFLCCYDHVVQVTVTGGSGVFGVIGMGGYASVGIQFEVCTPNMNKDGDSVGFAIFGSGGLRFDLVITSILIDMVTASKGWGSLSSLTGVSYIGDWFKNSLNNGNDGISDVEEGDSLTFRTADYGYGSKASGFETEKPVKAQPHLVSKTALLENAAEHTRPELTQLDDGRLFLTFIAQREEEGDSACLYYTVSTKDGWEAPKPVDPESGTFDSDAAHLKVTDGNGKEKVVIAWIDTDEEIDNLDDYHDSLNSCIVSVAVYDPETGIMSPKCQVSGRDFMIGQETYQDSWFDCNPHLSECGDTILLSFLTRDIDSTKDISELLDVAGNYRVIRQSEIDISGASETTAPSAKAPQILTFSVNTGQEDPLVVDYTSGSVALDDHDYLIGAYSVDLDGNVQDGSDRKAFLQITDRTTKTVFAPFMINKSDPLTQNVKLTPLGDQLYLTWVSDSEKIHIFNVNSLIRALFGKDETVNNKVYRDSADKADWFRQTAEAVMGEGNEEKFKESIYGQLAENDLGNISGRFHEGDLKGSPDDYRLVTDGKDIYIFFTAYETELGETSRELYGMCYTGSELYWNAHESGNDEQAFTKITRPVKITNLGKTIDELAIVMNAGRDITAVSNFYQETPVSGGMLRNENELTAFAFIPEGSMDAEESSIRIVGDLIPGNMVDIYCDAVNNGLLTAHGFTWQVEEVKNGEAKVLGSGESSDDIAALSEREIYQSWTVPEDLEDTKIVVKVSEKDVALPRTSVAEYTVPYEEKIELHDLKTFVDENGKGHLTGYVKNAGNKDGETCGLILSGNTAMKADLEKEFCTASVKALAAGETEDFDLSFDFTEDDFDGFGILYLKLCAVRNEETIESGCMSLICPEPVKAEVNGGAEKVEILKGEKTKLLAAAYPMGRDNETILYSSSDPQTVYIAQDGTVTGRKNGSAAVTAFYPMYGISDTITVSVVNDYSDPVDHSSGGASYRESGPQGAQRMIGRWQQSEDGSWKFLTSNGSAFTGWGYISTANGWDYYHLRADGIMDYGWYYDEKLKKWYYLNEQHDGRFGAMMRGWQLDAKDGKWYYLDPKTGEMCVGWVQVSGKWYYLSPGSTVPAWIKNEKGEWVYSGTGRAAGSMYANEKTPDGYEVDVTGAWTGK
ncbi:MAG: Ig-like domain-containing protein [Lachnospiraceae bacterium]|nr:Ig-like domain-containing protein [Lachnospiraceae bacterium]